MLRKLASIVRCYGFKRVSLIWQEQPPANLCQWHGLFPVREFFHEQEVGTSLHKCQYGIACLCSRVKCLYIICNTKVINLSEGGRGLPFLFLYCWQLFGISGIQRA